MLHVDAHVIEAGLLHEHQNGRIANQGQPCSELRLAALDSDAHPILLHGRPLNTSSSPFQTAMGRYLSLPPTVSKLAHSYRSIGDAICPLVWTIRHPPCKRLFKD